MYDLKLFDKVVDHLLKQNAKSETSPGGFCKYRGPNGLKCAVGFLISDDAYSTKLENNSPVAVNVKEALAKSGIDTSEDTLAMLCGLQRIHDRYEVSEWANEVLKFRKNLANCNLENRPIA